MHICIKWHFNADRQTKSVQYTYLFIDAKLAIVTAIVSVPKKINDNCSGL